MIGGPHTRLTRRGKAAAPVCRRARYEIGGLDADRFRQFLDPAGDHAPRTPTIAVADAAVDPAALAPLLDALAGVRVPAVAVPPGPPGTFAVDAGASGFEYHHRHADPAASVRFEWSHDVPGAWRPLVAAADAVRESLASLFPT